MPTMRTIRTLLARSWAFNPTLTVTLVLHAVLIPIAALLIFLDPVIITGARGWIKPTKFALSGAIYAATFGWLLTYVRSDRRWVQRLVQGSATLTGAALLVETTLISMQVMRGVPSHFNNTTTFDSIVFGAMGTFIFLLSLANLALVILLLFRKLDGVTGDSVFSWGLRWGVLVSFAGLMVGYLMVQPTPEQMAVLETGVVPAAVGAHSVGVADGGAGLPFLGWSTEGGDLRAAHFLGLHGMQILPIVAWVLSRRRLRELLGTGHRITLVATAGLGYLGLTALWVWQALRGQSIIAPDGLTWMAYAGLFAFIGLMCAGTWLHAQTVDRRRFAITT